MARMLAAIVLASLAIIATASLAPAVLPHEQVCGDLPTDASFAQWAASGWRAMKVDERSQWFQSALAAAKSSVSAMSDAPAVGSGRAGVVMVAGARHLRSAYLSLQLLKAHWPAAQAELFHVGTVPADARASFEVLGVTVRDLAEEVPADVLEETVSSDSAIRVGWKMHAVQLSTFDEVMLMDANVMPIRDPSSLFTSPEYTSTGALFFPTHYQPATSNPVWSVLGMSCQPGYEQDSAIMVINKHRMAPSVALALHFGRGSYQTLFRGDVDAMRMAAMATGASFTMSSAPVQLGGNDWLIDGERQFCAHARVQSSPSDKAPMFVQLLNNQMMADGSRADDFTCMSRHLPAVALSTLLPTFESSINQLESVLPEPIGRVRPLACTTTLTLTQMLDQVRAHASEELVLLDNLNKNQAKTETSNPLLLTNVCGFFTCGPSVDMSVQFWQLNTTRNATLEIRMSANGNLYPNDTYIGLIRSDGVKKTEWCASPVATGSIVTLTMSAENSTSYILGVAWAPPGRTQNMQVQIVYRGPIVEGFSAAASTSPLMAVVVALMALLAVLYNF